MPRGARFPRSKKRPGGSALVIILVCLAIIGILVPELIRANKTRNQAQNALRNAEALDGVVDAVTSRMVSELKPLFERYPNGPTNAGPPAQRFPASARYGGPKGSANNRVLPKGDPAFLVELRRLDGTSFIPTLFMAPETDPRGWIENIPPAGAGAGNGIGGGTFPLRITMQLCRLAIPRAVPAPPYLLNTPWPSPCPPNQIVQVDQTVLIFRAAVIAN
jgi:hypothetical protein